MHSPLLRALRSPLLLLAVLPALAGADTPTTSPPANSLVILSTTDVKGKTSPCGCHVPKGGLARQAALIDSIQAEYGRVVVVDNGGFFPPEDNRLSVVPFLLENMKLIGFDAVGVGERDLRLGLAYLKSAVKRSGLPVVSANLLDRNGKPVFQPFVIKRVGTVDVGIYGLVGTGTALGPAADSLRIEDPQAAARRTIAELRRKGADVIVLLSQLGKIDSEDLAVAVDGNDVVIAGHDVPMFQLGRTMKSTMVVYGGEQGQYMGRTLLELDHSGKIQRRDSSTIMLGAEVGEDSQVAERAKVFENDLNAKLTHHDETATPPTAAAAADSTRQ